VPVDRTPFGIAVDGTAVEAFTLANASGAEVRAMTYGARILSIRVPDRSGRLGDVALGFDDLAGYLQDSQYIGAVVGRYANRIAFGRFTLDGVSYNVTRNDAANHLHGGNPGFDKLVWTADCQGGADHSSVSFTLTSADGDQGYPGRLHARVTYALDDRNRLTVRYHATTDAPTVVNLTQHTYFDLSGGSSPDVLRHELTIHADHFTPVDAGLIPTGEIAPVHATPFDFRSGAAVGARIDLPDEQLRHARGYDHNFVLDRSGGGDDLAHAARLYDSTTGRVLDVYTTEPGLHFYSGNYLDGSRRGKSGRLYGRHRGMCVETQHFPDSPNHTAFPSTVLRPGEKHRSTTVFAFGVRM
jgi:aldose 1-epimerase